MKRFIIIIFLSLFFQLIFAQSLDIQLPIPRTTGGKPLFDVLRERKSDRNFSEKNLDLQTLSNLLWAAWGVNRPESGKRTAPSARNRQEIDLYVAMKNGLYKYDAINNKLIFILAGDIREKTGTQPFVKKAPINIVFVADLDKMGNGNETEKLMTAHIDAGFISQNIYLFCASEGLATVVRGMVNKEELSKIMKLKDNEKIIVAQTVGYPE